MFVPQKFEKKCEGKKINNKSEVKGNKKQKLIKIDLKSVNYF